MDKNMSKEKVVARATKFIAGARKRFPNGSDKLTLEGGVPVTIDQAVGRLQQLIDNRTAVTEAQATVKAKEKAERDAEPGLIAFMKAFEAAIRFTFGTDPTALGDFGLAPPKERAPQTAEQKAVAAAKRAATRKARGTKSAKAKKAVKGNVDAKLVVTPATADAAPAPAAPPPAAPPATQPKS
jgi:hypothetical protein